MSTERQSIVAKHIEEILTKLKCKPQGCAKNPYLDAVWGDHPYKTVLWGWDAYFIALRLAAKGEPQWLKYHTDNFLEFQNPKTGFIPQMHPLFSEVNLEQADTYYPLMAQGIWIYGTLSNDTQWVQRAVGGARRLLRYYETYQQDECGLFFNRFSWSGVDNDAATAFLRPGLVCSPWINSFLWLEYRALARIGRMLGDASLELESSVKGDKLKHGMERLMWSEEDSCYAPYNRETRESTIRMKDARLNAQGIGLCSFLSFTNVMPLYAGLADPARAKQVIEKYVLSPDHFFSRWGIRSLSKASEYYGNAVWGNPPRFESPERLTNSNWQGPVWVPCTYFLFRALLNYGYADAAASVTENITETLAADIEQNGMMHENYDAETGQPLYAKNFASWNVLADLMPGELETRESVCDLFIDKPGS